MSSQPLSYRVFAYRLTANVGDAIQSVALCRLLGGRGYAVYRDEILPSSGSNLPLIVNGWLGYQRPAWSGANCLFAGVHVAGCENDYIPWLRESGRTVGARDPYTLSLLRACQLPARFVGCATLTLPRYRGRRSGRFSVDVQPRARTTFLTNGIGPLTWAEQWELAVARLEQIRKAELIYTNRLHIILPCLAFGTPVIFPFEELSMVRGKNRLTILDTLGFAFNEAVTLDVSGYAGSFRSFLEKQLGCVLKSNPAVPKPTVLTPHVLDSDAPHLPKREARRPRVFYVCGNHISPVFGPEEMYQHVDLLNANGYEAYLVHRTPGFRCTWFPNETKVIDLAQVGLYYNALLDYVVLGDDLAHTYPTLGGRKVIFSKEMESLFCALSGGDGTGPIAVLCASDDGARLMSWSRPEVPAFPIRSRAVSDEFRFRPWSGKKPMIALAYDPSSTAELVIRLIMERTYRNHRFSRRFRWVRINDLHGQRLASSLGDALVLLNFENANRPMLSVEAMTCGCLTPFDAVQSARHVQLEKNEDPFEAAGLIERVMRSYPKCPVEIEPRIQQGQILARRYSRPQIEADVLAVWKRIISLSPID